MAGDRFRIQPQGSWGLRFRGLIRASGWNLGWGQNEKAGPGGVQLGRVHTRGWGSPGPGRSHGEGKERALKVGGQSEWTGHRQGSLPQGVN